MSALPPMATPRVAAGVLYRDGAGRVLLVKPTYKDGWDLPGGYVEPGESPLAAARREVVEELGAALPVAGMLLVDWAPHPDEGDKLLFIFDGGVLTAEDAARITPDGEEIGRVDFYDLDALDALMPERLVRRIRSAAHALDQPADRYAEQGIPVEHAQLRNAAVL